MGMDLHNVRAAVRNTLETRRLTQEAFARRNNLSSSWLNKFLREECDNPRFRSLQRLQKAIEREAEQGN
jgi:transcriptional regulator with XRE-family HTH domain